MEKGCSHKWKPVFRHGAHIAWPGVPTVGWHNSGIERCSRCGERVEGRETVADKVGDWVALFASAVMLGVAVVVVAAALWLIGSMAFTAAPLLSSGIVAALAALMGAIVWLDRPSKGRAP